MLYHLEQAVWGAPLLVLILGSGAYLTIRLRALPLRRLGKAMGLVFRRESGSGISPFAALCTSLSATIGTGNIVGVASALAIGGPGALFWMELSAVLGMAVKYAEGLLAVKYRYTEPDGTHRGGPFAYILLGLGRGWRPLAVCFALFGALAGICGVGTFVQIGSITACVESFCLRCVPAMGQVRLFGRAYCAAVIWIGLLLTVISGVVILGGIRKISGVSSVLVPVMGGIYVSCCLWILATHLTRLPAVLMEVVRCAVKPAAAGGGILGAIQAGVSRGVFSNEAGLGTSPIATAAVDADQPAEQGLISMTASVFDTLIVCTLTGLTILCTGAGTGALGVTAAMDAFARGLPFPDAVSRGLIVLCLTLFAFTTVLGWSYYGTACLDFLTGGKPGIRKFYLSLYTFTVFIAPYFPVQSLWQAASICNGLMAVPNLIGILLLSNNVVLDSRGIMGQKEAGGDARGTAVSGRSRDRMSQAARRALHRRARRNAGADPSAAGRFQRRGTDRSPSGSGGGRGDGLCPYRQSRRGSLRPDPGSSI